MSTYERLAALDTTALSDALDRHGLAGVVLGLQRLTGRGRVVGQAVTVQLGPDDGSPTKRHLCTAAVDASGPGKVVVVAHQGRDDVAGFGGLLALAATVRGASGVVVDGAVRDLDEILELGLSVVGLRAVPTTARGRVVEQAWDVPVTVSGIAVSPGDYVVSDASGTVVVPADAVLGVLETAESLRDREAQMAEAIRGGVQVSDVMDSTYESMIAKGGLR